jgi:hypothetical protein
MWDHVDKKRTSERVAAGLMTPVTLAVDAVVIAGGICLLAHASPGPSTMGDPSGQAQSSGSCGSWSNR